MAKNRLWCAALALCLIGLAPARASAWGGKAHRVIATLAVADRMLTQTAKNQLPTLLEGKNTLVPFAMWADEYDQRATANWHFVEIPLNAAGYDASRSCPGGNCLIAAIESQRAILNGYPRYTNKDRAVALRYLIHLIGDLHQPFHCVDNNDRGGNTVRVTFYGRQTTLHRLWDTDMIERVSLSEQAYADRLYAQAINRKTEIERGTTLEWAMQSREAARRAYNLPSNKTLGSSYYNSNRAVMDEQLMRAGVRLARIINESLR